MSKMPSLREATDVQKLSKMSLYIQRHVGGVISGIVKPYMIAFRTPLAACMAGCVRPGQLVASGSERGCGISRMTATFVQILSPPLHIIGCLCSAFYKMQAETGSFGQILASLHL